MKAAILLLILSAGLTVLSCKGKEKNKETPNTSTADTIPVPETTANTTDAATTSDDNLKAQVKDATKDFPDVTATVNNGEVTLTGTITREKLPRLMQSVQALNPKKVNNNLTIK